MMIKKTTKNENTQEHCEISGSQEGWVGQKFVRGYPSPNYLRVPVGHVRSKKITFEIVSSDSLSLFSYFYGTCAWEG